MVCKRNGLINPAKVDGRTLNPLPRKRIVALELIVIANVMPDSLKVAADHFENPFLSRKW